MEDTLDLRISNCPLLHNKSKLFPPESVHKFPSTSLKPYLPHENVAGCQNLNDSVKTSAPPRSAKKKSSAKLRHKRLKDLVRDDDCLALSSYTKAPADDSFSFAFGIRCESKYGFLFSRRDPRMSRHEFRENRSRFSKLPLCLRHSLLSDANTVKMRQAPLGESFFAADELKAEGDLYYEDGDYYSALERYELAYSLFQWLEITNAEMKEEFSKGKEIGIVDDCVKICEKDLGGGDCETETRLVMLINLLMSQSVVYCKLSHFKEAARCCDEALRLTQRSAEVYYRHSQTLTYDKGVRISQLEIALIDIDRALQMRPQEHRYEQHKELLQRTLETKLLAEGKLIESITRGAIKRLDQRQIPRKPSARTTSSLKSEGQSPLELKILKKMRTKYGFTLRFNRISPGERQNLVETIKEYQAFAASYWKYAFYYDLSQDNIPVSILSRLPPNLKSALGDKRLAPHFAAVKMARAKDTFFEAKLNIQMLQSALELVNKGDEKMRRRKEVLKKEVEEEGFRRWGSMSLQCCSMLFYVAIAVCLYLLVRYAIGSK